MVARRLRWPIYAPFICSGCAQLCLTGLWPVATLVSEALSAGFADAASTAIPAHSEAKATPSLEACSASAPVYGGLSQAQRNRLSVKVQTAASALGSPPSGSRSEQGAPVPPEPLCTLLEMGLTSPRLARLAGDCPMRPMRGVLSERRGGGWRRRRIRSWLLWQTPNILNKPRANL